jgi:hypothetical protein
MLDCSSQIRSNSRPYPMVDSLRLWNYARLSVLGPALRVQNEMCFHEDLLSKDHSGFSGRHGDRLRQIPLPGRRETEGTTLHYGSQIRERISGGKR